MMTDASEKKKPFVLVDAYSQIFRGFYAVRALTNSKGEPSNAVFAMTKLLLRLHEDHKGCGGAFMFDKGKAVKRIAIAPDYKANRAPMPEELRSQMPAIRDLIRAFGWPLIEWEGMEADDLIGCAAKTFADRDIRIISSDKDLSQLIDKNNRVTMLVPSHDGKGFSLRDYDGAFAKFGVTPERILDYLSLIGDSSDNIPGVPGVGPKTAVALIQEAGSVEEMLANPEKIGKLPLRTKITAAADVLRKNLKLIALDCCVPSGLPFGEDVFERKGPDRKAIAAIISRYELKSLYREVDSIGTSAVSAASAAFESETISSDQSDQSDQSDKTKPEKPEQLEFNF